MADHLDEIIAEARRKGAFDNLPGKGKPLPLGDTDPFAGDDAAGYKLLKEAGFTPEWIELRRQIADEVSLLRAHPADPDRPGRILRINGLIHQHNRKIPNPSLAFPKLPETFPY